MKRGPKPKPKAIKIFEGNPGKRPLNDLEPTPGEVKSLNAPDWLIDKDAALSFEKMDTTEIAAKVWESLHDELVSIGTLKSIDQVLFSRYCHTFALWFKAKAFIDRHGISFPVYKYETSYGADGTPKSHKILAQMKAFPQWAQYKELARALSSMEGEFGIGAASRTRIQAVMKSSLSIVEQDGNAVPGVRGNNPFDYASRAKNPFDA